MPKESARVTRSSKRIANRSRKHYSPCSAPSIRSARSATESIKQIRSEPKTINHKKILDDLYAVELHIDRLKFHSQRIRNDIEQNYQNDASYQANIENEPPVIVTDQASVISDLNNVQKPACGSYLPLVHTVMPRIVIQNNVQTTEFPEEAFEEYRILSQNLSFTKRKHLRRRLAAEYGFNTNAPSESDTENNNDVYVGRSMELFDESNSDSMPSPNHE